MKKICVVFNHFQIQDGIARSAIGMANELAKDENIEVTLRPLFKCDVKMKDRLSSRVKLKSLFGFYFQGFAKIIDLIPDKLLYKLVFREKYDIEIGYCMKLPIQIVASSTNQKSVHIAWMHGYDAGITLRPFYEKMDKVICVSKEGAQRFEKDTEGKIPVDFSYNLVNDVVVREMGNCAIEKEKTSAITFVGVGRLETGKGFLRLLQCAGRLKKEGYQLNIWLIGDGPQKEELCRTVKQLNLDEEVTFWGEQKNPHAITSKSDVFVCPSYGEGYSTACTEAIMLGIPVITMEVGGAKEIIEDAQAGILAGTEDEELYTSMKMVLENPQLIAEWKETISETRKKFSYVERVERLKKVLDI